MTLREQVEEAWPVSVFASTRELTYRRAVLDIIDAHDCRWAQGYGYAKEKFRIDPERLARALDAVLPDDINRHQPGNRVRAHAIAAAYEEQE